MNPIHKVFKPLYTSKKRYFLLTGGRSSLKSTSVHDFVCRLTYQSKHGILFTRYTMTSAHKSIIPEFEIMLNRLNVREHFNITKNKITNKHTGSFIIFSGIKTSSGDQTANLKSLAGITTWIIEEGEDFNNQKIFDIIDDSIRSVDRQNRVIWIQNPTTKEHFIYKRFIEPNSKVKKVKGFDVTLSNMEEVEHIHTTYHLAESLGYISEGWIEKANKVKLNNPKHYYHNYIGGWLEKAEGVIFENWEVGEFDKSLPYCYGLDFGFNPDPSCLSKIAVNVKEKIIYAEQIFYKTELSTDQIIKTLARTVQKNELIVADSSEKRLIHDIALKGFNIQPCIKFPNSVKKGIKDMLSYKLIICGESNELKKELNNYIWNDKKAGIPTDSFNHLIDATRYGFERLVAKSGFFVI
jgi:phage terminase large subunit